MKKKFTFLIAAVMLLMMMSLPGKAVGQVSWERVTSISTLTDGGTFIMGYEEIAKSGVIIPLRSKDCDATTKANGYFNTGTTDDSSTSGTIDMSNLGNVTTSDYEVYITASLTSGYINIQRTNSSGDYYGATSGGTTSNKGRLYTSGNSNETNLLPEWTSEANNQFKLTANVSGNYKYLKYNTGSPRFAFYNSAGEKIVFYKKVSGSGGAKVLTFNLTSNPGGWPTTNPVTLTNYTYTLGGVNYTFALKNVKCNSGYLMCTYTAVLGLPAIEGYKLTIVVAHNSSSCSTSTKVGISSSSSSVSYISGGDSQTWSTRDSDYTYTLTSTVANTMYYMYVTNANAQVTQLVLTYEEDNSPVFNPKTGSYAGSQSVTITAEEGATIHYTTDGSTPTSSSPVYNGAITVSSTQTLKAIAIKNEVSTDVSEATYTILTPLTTMEAVFNNAVANTSSHLVGITFNNWVVSGIYGSKAYVTDGTRGFEVSQSDHGFAVGNILSGSTTCNLSYITTQGYAQVTGLTATNYGLTVNTGGTVNPVTTTMDALTGANVGSVVTLNNVTCSMYKPNAISYYFVNDGNNYAYITALINPSHSYSWTVNQAYNVTGIYWLTGGQNYDASHSTYRRINPRNATDIVEVESSEPTINATPTSLTSFTYVEGDGPSDSQTISVSGTNLEENITVALNNETNFEISLSSGSGYTNSLTLTPTEGTVEATTVYVRLKAGLSMANNYADQINLTSTNATPVNVDLAGAVTGQEVTWNLTTASYASATNTLVTWSSKYVTMTNAKGNSGTNADSGLSFDQTRFYSGHVLTFTPSSGYAISSIEITAYSNSYANNFVSGTWVNGTATASNSIVTISPTNGDNPVSVTLGSAAWATSVTVHYEVSTLTPHNITNDGDMVNGTVVATPASAVSGATVTLKIYPAAGYYLENDTDIEVYGSSAIALTKVNAGTFTFTMPDEDVTVYALFSAYSGTYYTRVNSVGDLVPGRHYIIANSKEPGDAYVMAAYGSSYREAVSATVVGNTIYQTASVREIILSGDNSNFWTLYDDGTGNASKGYLYASNGLKNRLDNTADNNGKWAISINENGEATIVSQIDNTANTIKFNNSASPKRFSCYTSTSGQQSVYLYMKGGETDYELYSNTTYSSLTIGGLDIYTVHSPATLNVTGTLTNSGDHENLIIEDGGQLISNSAVAATVKKNITAASQWGNGDTYIPNNWYFIAAPITGSVSVDGLRTTGEGKDYDLYTLKESTSEWINQKEKELTIAQEKGYLYASEAGTTVTFAGTVQPNVPAGITVGLEKALEGWNLVGNPFPFDVYVNHSYYELDGERKTTEPVGANTKTIAPCTAIVVKATSAEDEIIFKQTAFSEGSLANNGDLQMTLTQTVANSTTRGESGSQTLDKAIVSFNEGSQLGKFYFGTQDANLYIPQDNEEYAIVSSNAQGEMPVNFRAYVTGEYTITVNPQEVEMGYLHLIDNIAGVEVDLLANPSYTFNARYDDYESRFRLVFSANMVNADLNDDFAFFSNGQLVIANEGESLLQVIDVTGRVVATENIHGTCSKAVNVKAGVYVLRLINGTDVKTQKIIVK